MKKHLDITVLLGLILLAPFVIGEGPDRWEGSKRLWLIRGTAVLAVFWLAFGCRIAVSHRLLPIIVLTALAWLRACHAPGIFHAAHWTACIVLAMMCAGELPNRFVLRVPLAMTGTIVAALGILQGLGCISIPQVPVCFRPASTFGNPNLAAHYVVATVPFLWTLRKRYAIPLSAISLSYLMWSGCLAALAVFWILAAVRCWRILFCVSARARIATATGLAVVVVAAGVLAPRKLSERIGTWANTARVIAEHPLGVGTAHFQYVMPQRPDRYWFRTHCDVLQMTCELGWLVVPVWAWLLICVLGLPGPERLGSLAILLCGLVSFPMYCAVPPLLLALFLSAADMHSHEEGRHHDRQTV